MTVLPPLNDIEKYVIEKFKLYQDEAHKEHDDQIFDKVYSLIIRKILTFLEENLSALGKDTFKAAVRELEKRAKDKVWSAEQFDESMIDMIIHFLAQIPNYQFKLKHYLIGYVDSLVYQAIKSHKV